MAKALIEVCLPFGTQSLGLNIHFSLVVLLLLLLLSFTVGTMPAILTGKSAVTKKINIKCCGHSHSLLPLPPSPLSHLC